GTTSSMAARSPPARPSSSLKTARSRASTSTPRTLPKDSSSVQPRASYTLFGADEQMSNPRPSASFQSVAIRRVAHLPARVLQKEAQPISLLPIPHLASAIACVRQGTDVFRDNLGDRSPARKTKSEDRVEACERRALHGGRKVGA